MYISTVFHVPCTYMFAENMGKYEETTIVSVYAVIQKMKRR